MQTMPPHLVTDILTILMGCAILIMIIAGIIVAFMITINKKRPFIGGGCALMLFLVTNLVYMIFKIISMLQAYNHTSLEKVWEIMINPWFNFLLDFLAMLAYGLLLASLIITLLSTRKKKQAPEQDS